MSEAETPTPPPPPANDGAPPPPPPAPPPDSGGVSDNRNVMIVLSYLGILALIPLLVEKNDKEVQWHAKHGLVLIVAEFVIWTALTFAALAGCIAGPILALVFLIIHVICIVKGLNGERFLIPGISQFADKF